MLLVIINNLYVGRSRRSAKPFKANPPLIVNANAVLALTVTAQCFKPVARKSGEITERSSGLHTIKLHAGSPFKTRKRLYTPSDGEISGPLVTVAEYQLTSHNSRELRVTSSVQNAEWWLSLSRASSASSRKARVLHQRAEGSRVHLLCCCARDPSLRLKYGSARDEDIEVDQRYEERFKLTHYRMAARTTVSLK